MAHFSAQVALYICTIQLETTKAEKGIAAILIVMHHISQVVPVFGPFKIMGYVGFILVALFFFISGYGLMYGLEHKKDYLKDFLQKRILSILVPYWIVNSIAIIINLMYSKVFSPISYIASIVGFDTVTGTWFVTAILIMYLIFYVSFMFTEQHFYSKKIGIILLSIIVALYCIVCYYIGLHSSWTASVTAFIFGLVWSSVEQPFSKWIQQKFWMKATIIVGLFGFVFCGRLALAFFGIENVIIHFAFRNAASVLFIMAIIVITQKVKIGNKVLYWLGGVSYELYITHYVLLKVLRHVPLSDGAFSIILLCLSIIGAWMVQKLSKKILGLINPQKRDTPSCIM